MGGGVSLAVFWYAWDGGSVSRSESVRAWEFGCGGVKPVLGELELTRPLPVESADLPPLLLLLCVSVTGELCAVR
jgi:hypothetical protein